MPLILADYGVLYTIRRVGGSDKIRHYLGGLGFVAGAQVMLLSEFGCNFIVLIKGTRIAIAKEYAKKIIV